jgi:hypothetical protein
MRAMTNPSIPTAEVAKFLGCGVSPDDKSKVNLGFEAPDGNIASEPSK